MKSCPSVYTLSMKKWCREKQEQVIINLNNAAFTFAETSHKKFHLFFKKCDYL